MPFARERPGIDQFLRIDPGGWRAGDVADVVGAGAARAQPQILDRLDHGDCIVRFDFADLDIGARGDMRIAAAITLGEIGEAGKLRGFEDAVRDPQAAHIRVLVRRDIEQAEEPPAEIVGGLGIFAFGGVVLQPLVGVERMLLALELFLIGQFAARCEQPVLRFQTRPHRARPARAPRAAPPPPARRRRSSPPWRSARRQRTLRGSVSVRG